LYDTHLKSALSFLSDLVFLFFTLFVFILGVFVIRPDSGDPPEVVVKVLNILRMYKLNSTTSFANSGELSFSKTSTESGFYHVLVLYEGACTWKIKV